MKSLSQKKLEVLGFSKQVSNNTSLITQSERSLKIEDSLTQPAVRSVFKGDNGDIGYSFFYILITRFVDSFGFSTKLNTTQLETLTIDALDHFSYESVVDAILFFKMARSGKFGTTNRGLDSNLIFGTWFPLYLELKADAREVFLKKQKENLKNESVSIESVQKHYKECLKGDFKKKCKKRIDELTKDFDRQMLEDFITDWEKDETKKPFLKMLKAKRRDIK